MKFITKAHETMTSKERVAKTFGFEKTDRVTIGYETNAIIHNKLCRELGIGNADHILLCKALGVDYLGVNAKYIGKPIFDDMPDRQRNPETGSVTKYIENDFGGYWDFCDFPLKDATDEQIYDYPCTSPDDYD